jgi:hypothetical protein
MKILQFNQLTPAQRTDAIIKMINISKELNVEIAGVKGDKLIDAINHDFSPDADFIFDEIDEARVDVIYRENI